MRNTIQQIVGTSTKDFGEIVNIFNNYLLDFMAHDSGSICFSDNLTTNRNIFSIFLKAGTEMEVNAFFHYLKKIKLVRFD